MRLRDLNQSSEDSDTINPRYSKELRDKIEMFAFGLYLIEADKTRVEPWDLPEDYYDDKPTKGSGEYYPPPKRLKGGSPMAESDKVNQLENNNQKIIIPIVAEPDPVVVHVAATPIVPAPERKKMDLVSLRADVPREMHKQLKIYAINQQRTVSSIVIDLINQLDLKSHS